MIHWQLGEKTKARDYYEAAIAGDERRKQSTSRRWWRILNEAEELLGLPLSTRPPSLGK